MTPDDSQLMMVNGAPSPEPVEATPDAEQMPAPEEKKPEPPEDRKNLVKDLTKWAVDARTFWKPVHDRMRRNMERALGRQWGEASNLLVEDRYQVNFIQRQINYEKDNIYAQNPTLKCIRRPRLEYEFWDGSREQLQMAGQALLVAGQKDSQAAATGGLVEGPPENETNIVMDYDRGQKKKKLLEKIADTLELLMTKQWDLQSPDFETQMKEAVIREKTCSVAFVAVKFERENETVATNTADTTSLIDQLKTIAAKAEKLKDDDSYQPDDGCHEELRLMVENIQKKLQDGQARPKMERIVFDFKPSTSILVDKNCRNLREFQGCNRISEMLYLTSEEVLAHWGVDVKNCPETAQYTQASVGDYTKAGGKANGGSRSAGGSWDEKMRCCVFIIYDKTAQMKYVVCEGYEDFLEEPESPWPAVTGFWQIAALKFRDTECEENDPEKGLTCYGQSDVELMTPMQEEVNRTQEGLRQHRIANRPGYIATKGALTTQDRKNFAQRNTGDVFELDNVPPGMDPSKVIVPIPAIPIEESLYDIQGIMNQVALVVGSQSSNLGEQQQNEKATGQAIAEQGRITSVSSDVDSQDKFLNTIVRISSEMALLEMAEETVKKLVGPGAAWPLMKRDMQGADDPNVLTREDCIDQLLLKVDAASSGRPNKAADIANLKELLPLAVPIAQQMGLPMDPFIRKLAKLLDMGEDMDEWLASGVANQLQAAAQQAGNVIPMPGQQNGQRTSGAPAPTAKNSTAQPSNPEVQQQLPQRAMAMAPAPR